MSPIRFIKPELAITGTLVLILFFWSLYCNYQVFISQTPHLPTIENMNPLDLKQLNTAIQNVNSKDFTPPSNIPLPIATVSAIASPSAQLLKTQIYYTPGSIDAVANLKINIESLDGLSVISVEELSTNSNSVLEYKSNLPSLTKTALLKLLKETKPDIAEESLNEDSPYDLVIILGS